MARAIVVTLFDNFTALVLSLSRLDVADLQGHHLLLVSGALLNGVPVLLLLLVRAGDDFTLRPVQRLRVHLRLSALVHVAKIAVDRLRLFVLL